METGISRALAVVALSALVCAGCGGSISSSTHAVTSAAGASGAQSAAGGNVTTRAFAWLRPQAPPAGWRVARIPTGATFSYPPGWRIIAGDRDTATAALTGSHGRYLGYLNLTPRQGSETLAGWSKFRIGHNAEEGDRAIAGLAAATDLRFRSGRGSCVKDAYTTSVGARYVEIACLVAGTRGSAVIVGAAPPATWARTSGLIERSIEGFTT